MLRGLNLGHAGVAVVYIGVSQPFPTLHLAVVETAFLELPSLRYESVPNYRPDKLAESAAGSIGLFFGAFLHHLQPWKS